MQNAGMHHNYSETLVLRKDTFFGLNGGFVNLIIQCLGNAANICSVPQDTL